MDEVIVLDILYKTRGSLACEPNQPISIKFPDLDYREDSDKSRFVHTYLISGSTP